MAKSGRDLLEAARKRCSRDHGGRSPRPAKRGKGIRAHRRARAGRVPGGLHPRGGAREPGLPGAQDRAGRPRPGDPHRRLLRGRGALPAGGAGFTGDGLPGRPLHGGRLREVEGPRPPGPGGQADVHRAAEPLQPPLPPQPDRRARPGQAPRIQGAPHRGGRARQPDGALPDGGRGGHHRHRGHGRGGHEQPPAPDPPHQRSGGHLQGGERAGHPRGPQPGRQHHHSRGADHPRERPRHPRGLRCHRERGGQFPPPDTW